ncbi:glycosyltransferase, partial [Candidatus Sumerlaeota bacterium]|nr:glycosyltransferase [Candidatus Sumerlaeota bacterium]
MKILHVIPSLDTGGAEQLTVNLAYAQKQAGHEAELCCIMTPPEKGALYEKAQSFGFSCHYSYARHEPRFGSVWKLRRLIRSISPDVVQSHLPRTNAVTTIAARLSGVRCVISTFHNPYIWKNKRQEKWGRFTSFLPDGFFCDSNSIRDNLIKFRPGLEKKIRVVYPSLPFHEIRASREDIADFRKTLGIGEKDKLVGIVARLADVKDHNTFIDAARIVLEKEKNVRFLIVGDGPQKNLIDNKIREQSLENKIHLAGYIPNLDIIWAQLDIFALTSISEGFPLSILEALNAGVPVVASKVGGVPEIIIHGKNGFLSPPREPELFAEHILHLLRDEILLEKMRRNAEQSI